MASTSTATMSRYDLHSTETDRRHLLAPSTAPSAAPSLLDFPTTGTADADADEDPTANGAGTRTPRAHSPSPSAAKAPSHESKEPYRGFASRAAYLAALHEWAESKKYIHYNDDGGEGRNRQLRGFYGETTMAEYAARPPALQLGLRKKWRARKERKASVGR